MDRLRLLFVLVVALGIFIVTGALAAGAQSDDPPEYMGTRECGSCHRDLKKPHEASAHNLAFQDTGAADLKGAIVADFAVGEELRQITPPGKDQAAAFQIDDVAYAIGSGRNVQRYVYLAEDGRRLVLPAEWNVALGEWSLWAADEEWPAASIFDFDVSCAGCHTTGYSVEAVDWEETGVQCEACHGPGSNHVDLAGELGRQASEEELNVARNAIVRSPDPQVCGRCHSQGLDADDQHRFSTSYVPGGDLLSSFNLVAADDPNHWWVSGHARDQNMQFNEWLESGHASALETMLGSESASDECLACHSGDYRFALGLQSDYDEGYRDGDMPQLPTLAQARYGVTCTVCHDPHITVDDEEAQYLLREDGNALCVSCHTATDLMPGQHHPVQQMLEGASPVESVAALPSAHFAAEDGPDCLACHMLDVAAGTVTRASHRLKPVRPDPSGEGPASACEGCHQDLSAQDLLYLIEDVQKSVRERLVVARARVGGLTVPEEGSSEALSYAEVVAALDFVQNDGSLGVHNYALSDQLLTLAERQISQLNVAGSVLQPTEAPAPTAVGALEFVPTASSKTVRNGWRPVTGFMIGLGMIVLLLTGFVFIRSARKEA